jgi:cytochrome c oxidase cbb3-type subunit 2
MNRSSLIFVGLLLIFLTSFIGLVIVPYVQLGRLLPDIDDTTRDQTPAAFPGIAEQGRAVYAANGCVYCHSQQVRSRKSGSDLDRGWGGDTDPRRTVARDYLRDRAAYLGASRMGPDLANVGSRRDKADWHFQHLYDPAEVAPGSNCPPMHFLFERRTIVGQPSIDALQAPGAERPVPGRQELVPTPQAKALVAYLMSLKRSSYKLPEAPSEPAEP